MGDQTLGNDTFGRTVAALGDFDGDGVVDFAAGTPNEAIGGYSRGAIRILRLNAATFDYGDAPDTGAGTGAGNYATTLADGGPRHIITAGLQWVPQSMRNRMRPPTPPRMATASMKTACSFRSPTCNSRSAHNRR